MNTILFYYSLTAPFITPEMNCLCKNKKNIMIGAMDIIAPAAIKRQSEVNVPDSIFSPSGNVNISLSPTIINGQRKSPYAVINVNIVNVKIDGFTSGIKILNQIWKLFAPSILADSSKSYGMTENACRIKNTPKAVVICGNTIPAYVLSNPQFKAIT